MAKRVGTALRRCQPRARRRASLLVVVAMASWHILRSPSSRATTGRQSEPIPMTRSRPMQSLRPSITPSLPTTNHGTTAAIPGFHRYNVCTPLSPEVAPHVREGYVRLGHPSLLRRCPRGQPRMRTNRSTPRSGRNVQRSVLLVWRGSSLLPVLLSRSSTVGLMLSLSKQCEAMGIESGWRLLASAKKADTQHLKQSFHQHEGSEASSQSGPNQCTNCTCTWSVWSNKPKLRVHTVRVVK